MTPPTNSRQPVVSGPAAPATADDWSVLARQLLADFPDATLTDVVREVRQARDAVEAMAVDPAEAVALGATIARHQLMIATGRNAEVARVYPESRRASRRK